MSPARKKVSPFHARAGYWIAFVASLAIPLARSALDFVSRFVAIEQRITSLQEQNDVQNARIAALERGGR